MVEPFGSPIKFQFKLSLTQTEHAICPGEQKDFVAGLFCGDVFGTFSKGIFIG